MANTKEVRKQISSIKSTRKITSALEMVAASKIKKTQDTKIKKKDFLNLCLEKNIENEDTIYNLALSNVDGKQDLFVDTAGGNSSLSGFGTESKSQVESRTFDSFKFKNIKLLKIDGEGFEPEILSGCSKSLSEIEFIKFPTNFSLLPSP